MKGAHKMNVVLLGWNGEERKTKENRAAGICNIKREVPFLVKCNGCLVPPRYHKHFMI